MFKDLYSKRKITLKARKFAFYLVFKLLWELFLQKAVTFALLCHFCVPKEAFLWHVRPCHFPLQIPGQYNLQTGNPAFIDVEGSFWNMSTEPVLHLPLEHCDPFSWLTGVFKAVNMAADTGGL